MKISCALRQSIICQQGAEWPTERQEKMGGATCRERGELWERVRLKRFTIKLWRKLNV